MGKQNQNFEKRFGGKVEVIYAEKPLEGEDRRLNRKSLIEALRVVMLSALNREPTREELLGIHLISPPRKRGARC